MRSAAFVLVLLLGLSTASEVSALKCNNQTLAQQLEGSTAVFVGRVTKSVAVDENAKLLTFQVSRSFRGVAAPSSVTVWSASSPYQWPFAVGDEYLLFATKNDNASEAEQKKSAFWTFVCMGDQMTTQAPEETKKTLAELQQLVDDRARGNVADTTNVGTTRTTDTTSPTDARTFPPTEPQRVVTASTSAPRAVHARSGCAGCTISSGSHERSFASCAWWLVACAAILCVRRRR